MGIEAEYDYTQRVYRRIVCAATKAASFNDACALLTELTELQLTAKRVWRATLRIGKERMAECDQAAAEYQQLTLPAQRESPVAQIPQVACAMMDGGRHQERERNPSPPDETATPAVEPPSLVDDSSDNSPANAPGKHWCEFKAGTLMSMTSEVCVEDPCPTLPATFADPGKMRERAREIKGFTSESPVSPRSAEAAETKIAKAAADEAQTTAADECNRPKLLVKSVVATSGNVDVFGLLLASAAYARGFHAAVRKAFVSDGSAGNWGVWSKHFSHYTPILDFVHALMYVYAGAMAGRSPNEGWLAYRDWAQWLWEGSVDRVLAALAERQQQLGLPERNEKGTPRAQVASSLGYLTNQRARMKYDEYRQQGLPITSSPMESTVKQINRRIKGTEKFWDDGADPMLHLKADELCQTDAVGKFWSRRLERLIQSASYHAAA